MPAVMTKPLLVKLVELAYTTWASVEVGGVALQVTFGIVVVLVYWANIMLNGVTAVVEALTKRNPGVEVPTVICPWVPAPRAMLGTALIVPLAETEPIPEKEAEAHPE